MPSAAASESVQGKRWSIRASNFGRSGISRPCSRDPLFGALVAGGVLYGAGLIAWGPDLLKGISKQGNVTLSGSAGQCLAGVR